MHKCIVAKIDKTVEIQGANNIQVGIVLGESVVISKNIKEGHIGLFFPVDLQLSEEFCRVNNLNRDSTKNADQTKKGFFDANRRVRAQPFLKVKSQGYFTELDSIQSFSKDKIDYPVGFEFDSINGVMICQKYISEQARKKIANSKNQPKKKLASYPLFEKHVDSEQFKYKADYIEIGSLISIHAKVHGTSFRVSKSLEYKELSKFKTFVNKFVPVFKDKEYKVVVGSRNVIIGSPEKEGFHGSEAYRFEVAKQIEPFLEDGMTVFGEIAGFVNGSPVMPVHDVKTLKDKSYTKKYGDKNTYSYGCKEHEYRFHIYRITRQTVNGENIDMSQKEMESWCKQRELNCTFEVHPQFVYDGDVEKLKILVENLTERGELLAEDYIDPSHIGEGVILRIDKGGKPYFLKSKTYAHRVMEGHQEADDVETLS